METITTTPQNHYINKYGKTLHQLTWFALPPADDPLNIMENKPIVKETRKKLPPTFIPNDIMSNILSYLPPPVIKAEEYGIMNNKNYDGKFMIIKKITPKFIVYDRFKLYENGHSIIMLENNKRSKLRKDKARRCYYIFYQNEEYIVDNKYPVRKIYGSSCLLDRTLLITKEQYKQTLRENYYYSDYSVVSTGDYYWFNRK